MEVILFLICMSWVVLLIWLFYSGSFKRLQEKSTYEELLEEYDLAMNELLKAENRFSQALGKDDINLAVHDVTRAHCAITRVRNKLKNIKEKSYESKV